MPMMSSESLVGMVEEYIELGREAVRRRRGGHADLVQRIESPQIDEQVPKVSGSKASTYFLADGRVLKRYLLRDYDNWSPEIAGATLARNIWMSEDPELLGIRLIPANGYCITQTEKGPAVDIRMDAYDHTLTQRFLACSTVPELRKTCKALFPPVLDYFATGHMIGYNFGGDTVNPQNIMIKGEDTIGITDPETMHMDTTWCRTIGIADHRRLNLIPHKYTRSYASNAVLQGKGRTDRSDEIQSAAIMVATLALGLRYGYQTQSILDNRREFLESEKPARRACKLGFPGLDVPVKKAMRGEYPTMRQFHSDMCESLYQ